MWGQRGLVVAGRTTTARACCTARVAALFYTLIESAKLAGVDSAAYLAEATLRAGPSPGTDALPHDLR